MSVSDKLRVVLAGILIFVALFYKKENIPNIPIVPPKPVKIVKPTDDLIKFVSVLSDAKVSSLDGAKLSGAFSAFSEFIKTNKINTAIELEMFIAGVGKSVFGKDFINSDGKSKYPTLSSDLAILIDKMVGGQSSNKKFTDEEKTKLSQLFNAIAWQFYTNDSENEYDVYLAKTKQAISDYYNIKPGPIPDPNPNTKCPLGLCDGSGKIVQGDGHITECPHLQSKEIKQ